MHKTHIFDQKNNEKKQLFTDLPTLFFSDRYRKQTISFFRPSGGKASILCLKLTIKKLLTITQFVLRGDFWGFGWYTDAQTPCWLRLNALGYLSYSSIVKPCSPHILTLYIDILRNYSHIHSLRVRVAYRYPDQGSIFPGAHKFCCGPLDFSD